MDPNTYPTDVPVRGDLQRTWVDPPTGIVAVTPSDTTEFCPPLRGFEVTAAGDVAVLMLDGSTGVLPSRQPGPRYTGVIRKILATGTNATGIIGYR